MVKSIPERQVRRDRIDKMLNSPEVLEKADFLERMYHRVASGEIHYDEAYPELIYPGKEEYFIESGTIYKSISGEDGGMKPYVFQHKTNKWVSIPFEHYHRATYDGREIEKSEAEKVMARQLKEDSLPYAVKRDTTDTDSELLFTGVSHKMPSFDELSMSIGKLFLLVVGIWFFLEGVVWVINNVGFG